MTVGISLDAVLAFQKSLETTNDWCRSVKPIQTVFSNWDTLCASFPRQVLSSSNECQVDKRAARIAFNILKNEVPESVFMKLSEALKGAATAAVRTVDQFTAHKLNGIVILYQCHDTFLSELCELFAALDMKWQDLALEQIIEPLDNTDYTAKETFETFLESLHSLIQTRLSCQNLEDKKNSAYQDTVVINGIKTMAVLNRMNERCNYVPYTRFYNAKVNEHVDIKIDLPNHKERKGFAFCDYPFILNTTVKADILRVESVFQMRHELQDAFFRALFEGVNSPYLVLSIRRSRLVADTLYHLERSTIHDLKKQLRVQFVGEDGVDEGGVQKEFFHLVIRELFDPKYGMFTMNEETRMFWFSPDLAQEGSNYAEYKLAGLLLGLAVYNAVVLDLHMPLALYKKLMGYSVGFEDLQELDPSLSRGLKQLLNFDGDVASEFERTFQVDIRLYDKVISADLVRDGSQIYLNNDNRHEFVELYANFILNKSVEKQFNAFAEGFQLLCQDSAINMFRPEELQQLLCGSSELDFDALEKATVYDGGWTRDSPVIRYFWEIVHEFSYEEKKKLLFFATGSDRAPIGGLGRLQFVIAKNGADSERLPTSHTCYNVLLLSEYNSKEQLRERLLTSISNAEGFGMI